MCKRIFVCRCVIDPLHVVFLFQCVTLSRNSLQNSHPKIVGRDLNHIQFLCFHPYNWQSVHSKNVFTSYFYSNINCIFKINYKGLWVTLIHTSICTGKNNIKEFYEFRYPISHWGKHKWILGLTFYKVHVTFDPVKLFTGGYRIWSSIVKYLPSNTHGAKRSSLPLHSVKKRKLNQVQKFNISNLLHSEYSKGGYFRIYVNVYAKKPFWHKHEL